MQFGETKKGGSWTYINFCGLLRKPELYTNNSPKGVHFGETKKKEVGHASIFVALSIRKPEFYTNNSPKGMQFGETNEEGSWTCPNREVYLAFNFGSRKY